MAGTRLTTKVQVSGWRFLLRRVEHAIVRRDTRMFDDPLKFYSRSVAAGVVIASLVAVGAVLAAYFKPLGKRGDDSLVVDRSTNQLYVILPGSSQLRPVYNLTSARLVLGNAGSPVPVKSEELNKIPKGQTVGIPGAPYATPVTPDPASTWSLCDTVMNAESVAPTVETAAIVVPLTTDSAIGPMAEGQGLVVSFEGRDWLMTKDGRHAIDIANRAVSAAVGIPVMMKSSPISQGLFNAIKDAGPWALPPIAKAGEPNPGGLPPNLVIGSVFQVFADNGPQDYVVLPDGVAKINPITASALRATDSHGLVAPPMIETSVVARVPERVYPSPLPDAPLNIVNRTDSPVLCWTWVRGVGEQSAQSAVLAGRRLPLTPDQLNAGIKQITGGLTVFIQGGQFIRLQAPDPRYGEGLYYVDPQGVRYGITDEETAKVLDLFGPKNAPWQVVNLLVDGPVLSKQAALVEHDTLPSNPQPRSIETGGGR
jgi:type VII secretion protein EccB